MYVDDNDIFVTSDRHDQVTDIIQKSQQCITKWKENLSITGGIVRPDKCSWVLIDFKWTIATYEYKTIPDSPAEIYLADENGNVEQVKRVSPATAVLGLGIYLAADGNEKKQFEYMEQSITSWLNRLTLSPLPPSMNFQAMHTRILRTLFYPLPVTCLKSNNAAALKYHYILNPSQNVASAPRLH